MTRDELHNALLLLLVGGLDTVTASLGLAVEYLAGHPEVRHQMIDEPDLIPSAVEEFLRYFALINIHREVVQDTRLGGVQLRRGDYVGVCIPAANRDDERFPDAGEVDIQRSPNPHLGFGAGPHRCLGSHLARMEMAVAFEEICRRMPDFAVTDGTVPRHHFGGVMGIEELHLTIPPCS
jgi:cytochrome P450